MARVLAGEAPGRHAPHAAPPPRLAHAEGAPLTAQADPARVRAAATLREAGRLDEARAALDPLLAGAPDDPDARRERGLARLLAGDADGAAADLEVVLARVPDDRLGLLNLGNARLGQGRVEEAAALYARAAARDPRDAVATNNLGHALERLGRLEDAAEHYARALALDPGSGLALGNLRQALTRLERPERLQACVEAAARAGGLEARLAWSELLREAGRAAEALALAEAAAGDAPGSAAARVHVGLCRQALGRIDDAAAAFAEAVALDPGLAAGHACLAGAWLEQAKVKEALAAWGRATALAPAYDVAASNRLLALHYDGDQGAEAVAREHRAWGAAVRRRLGPAPDDHDNDRDPDRRLRVGYLSADLRGHPVAAFLEPVLAGQDRGAVEVLAYSAWPAEDEVTRRLRGLVDGWRRVHALDDAALAAQVRADRIDVLVDLGGHTGGNRLLAVARRPAPVQVTWLGYADTTGLDVVDARLTDAAADPPGRTEHLHTEALVRLPRPFLAWAPPEGAPDPAAPAPDDPGAVTFGCFNTLPKVDRACVALWARLLAAVPGARLLLKAHGLAHAAARARVEGLFAAHGVTADRLVLTGRVGWREHLALHGRVGVMLDPFPYAGTTTTVEALWMGCPVVTLAGDRHAARVGVSLLEAVGLGELVARTPEEYVALAAGLARDPARLAALRAGLRARVAASPLVDGPGLARALEAAWRGLWRAWCGRRR